MRDLAISGFEGGGLDGDISTCSILPIEVYDMGFSGEILVGVVTDID